MPDITCSRCGQTREGFERPPCPGAVGQRVVTEICQQCWGEWLRQQTMLINHYKLIMEGPVVPAGEVTAARAWSFCSSSSFP